MEKFSRWLAAALVSESDSPRVPRERTNHRPEDHRTQTRNLFVLLEVGQLSQEVGLCREGGEQ